MEVSMSATVEGCKGNCARGSDQATSLTLPVTIILRGRREASFDLPWERGWWFL